MYRKTEMSRSEMTRNQITEVFVVRAAPADRPELRRTLEKMSFEELEQAHQALISQQELGATEEKLLRIQAERAADAAMHQYYRQKEREPQAKAEAEQQEKQDRETFRQACREYNISNIEANFSLIRHTLGPNFNLYQVGQAVTSGAVQAAGATEQEQEQWRQEAIEAHNLRLLTADLPTLRKLAREAGARGPVAPPQLDETQRIRAAERIEDTTYPPLPEEFRDGNGPEQVLDASFIKRCSRETYRLLFDRYGSAQITEALRTRVPGNSW